MSDIISQTAYEPQKVEPKWYDYWLKLGLFHARVDSDKPAYCIVIPPPNVTGALHIGHALQDTIMDLLTRYKRMRGFEVLWLPGTDHAGIATQARVERHLKSERGLTRYDLGREKFLEEMWRWKEHYHARITEQLKRMGAGLDWQRERFTMDEHCSRAVREAFCRFYERGLIYRGLRIINWCPQDRTALSDEEVEHIELKSHLWTIEYPLEDGSGGIRVATTRPETMLGDTAVAVHPDDERYRDLVGKKVILPLMERPIPIVADKRVDPSFGTGAVKVTPAHDPVDFEIGQEHKLPLVQVIGEDGKMTEDAGRYAGLDRVECREQVLRDLEQRGLLVSTEDYTHSVGQCSRCNTIIEPLASEQWFVRMKPLAQMAIEASRAGKLRFVPERWEKVYLDWLANIRDWCISRQLWWGHRIPVWYCDDCGAEMCLRRDPTRCTRCGSANIRQDEDVLDTWFSSGLWPFSTLGWPDNTPDMRRFFPTSVLVTGYDIIFFWVVRMVTMSLFFTGKVPFHTVFITGLVRDERGRKYSKSLANQVDPIDLIERYGTDALRFALASLITHGQDIKFSEQRVAGGRNFCNKLYNATRFVVMNLQDFVPSAPHPMREDLDLPDRWILSRLNKTIDEITEHIENYDIADAARRLHEFAWHEFCDWYVELSKPALQSEDKKRRRTTQWVLWRTLSVLLRLLHPLMPFITEELWHALPGTQGSVQAEPWPIVNKKALDPEAEEQMQPLMDAVYGVRTIRAEFGISPVQALTASFRPASAAQAQVLREREEEIAFLARLEQMHILGADDPNPEPAFRTVVGTLEVLVHAEGTVDLEQQRERLRKQLAEARGLLERIEAKLANEQFVQRAPEEVVQRERERRAEVEQRIATLQAALSALGAES